MLFLVFSFERHFLCQPFYRRLCNQVQKQLVLLNVPLTILIFKATYFPHRINFYLNISCTTAQSTVLLNLGSNLYCCLICKLWFHMEHILQSMWKSRNNRAECKKEEGLFRKSSAWCLVHYGSKWPDKKCRAAEAQGHRNVWGHGDRVPPILCG